MQNQIHPNHMIHDHLYHLYYNYLIIPCTNSADGKPESIQILHQEHDLVYVYDEMYNLLYSSKSGCITRKNCS